MRTIKAGQSRFKWAVFITMIKTEVVIALVPGKINAKLNQLTVTIKKLLNVTTRLGREKTDFRQKLPASG